MQINPYLLFNGQCEEAFQFYAKTFGGTIQAMIPHAGTPVEAQVSPEWLSKIMHARMTVGSWVLMGSDTPPDRWEGKPHGFSVHLGAETPEEAERVFAALADGSVVVMPIQTTFWAVKFGMLVDRFGIPWMINCEAKQQ